MRWILLDGYLERSPKTIVKVIKQEVYFLNSGVILKYQPDKYNTSFLSVNPKGWGKVFITIKENKQFTF